VLSPHKYGSEGAMAKSHQIGSSAATSESRAEYILTEAEKRKLRERALIFSARRDAAIGWIDQTLLALRKLKRVSR
jgi:hypothetical protein